MLLPKAEQELAFSPAHASYAKKLQVTPLFIGPVHTYPDTFESTACSFRDGHPSTHIRCWSAPFWIRSPGWKVLNPLHVSGYAWTVNADIFLSSDVTKSIPVLYPQWILYSHGNLYSCCVTNTPRGVYCSLYSVPGSEIVGPAELRKLEHVSTNRIKVLRLWLTCFEHWPIRILTFA